MAIDHFLNEACTITRRSVSGTNSYGSPAIVDGSATATVGYLTQESSTEFLDGRDTVVSRWVAYLPAGTVIGALDYITFQSQKFEVDGVPEQCYNPRTKTISHQRAQLVVVSG